MTFGERFALMVGIEGIREFAPEVAGCFDATLELIDLLKTPEFIMSCDVSINVFGKSAEEIFAVVQKNNLGHIPKDEKVVCIAGFWFSIYRGDKGDEPYYSAEEITEFKEEDCFHPWMEKQFVHLNCCTNMGWGLYGDTRELQFPVAHVLAQSLAIYLGTEVMVVDPQSGRHTFYRRTNHPEVHAVLNEEKNGMSMDCPNFCQQRDGEDGEWKYCGYRSQREFVLGEKRK